MIFDFKNIGPIAQASIEINGLTVITGTNDCGKSFLSKSIYGTIQSHIQAFNREFVEYIRSADSHINAIRELINSNLDSGIAKTLPFVNELHSAIFSRKPENEIASIYEVYMPILNEAIKNADALDSIDENLNTILAYSRRDRVEGINDYFRISFEESVIQGLFRSQITNIQQNKEAYIGITDNQIDYKITELFIKEKNISNIQTFVPWLRYHDVTMIDTPLILTLSQYIRQQRVAPTVNRKIDSSIPSYYLDLLSKIGSVESKSSSRHYKEYTNDIETLIGGKFSFDTKSDLLRFTRQNGDTFDNFNIATGIKSIGILQLLLNANVISDGSVLIIDEPEVHLHPQWQIKYAEILVQLSKSGVPIILSSHSSFFLEALTFYIKEYEISDKSKFYFGEKGVDGMSTFNDVSGNLNPIFKKLSEPLMKLF